MTRADNGASGQSLQAFMDAGLKAHQAGRLADAEAAYRQALDLDGNHADANHLLGLIARQKGNLDSALQLFSKAIQINPGVIGRHRQRGVSFFLWYGCANQRAL